MGLGSVWVEKRVSPLRSAMKLRCFDRNDGVVDGAKKRDSNSNDKSKGENDNGGLWAGWVFVVWRWRLHGGFEAGVQAFAVAYGQLEDSVVGG